MLRDITYSAPKEALPEMEMSLFVTPLFRPGEGYITPEAHAALKAIHLSPVYLLSLHLAGDWTEVSEADRLANERAVDAGEGRIVSSYIVRGIRFGVVTEADRGSTTIRLPEGADEDR